MKNKTNRTLLHLLGQGLLILFAVYCLLAGIINFSGVLSQVGTPSLGFFYHWYSPTNCHIVDPLTPAFWPPLASGVVQPGDCIVSVNDLPVEQWGHNHVVLQEMLAQAAAAEPQERFLRLELGRQGETIKTSLPAVRFDLYQLLQSHLAIFLVGTALWLLGLISFAAQPHAAANVALALACLAGSLFLFGSKHLFNDEVGRVFTASTIVISRSLLGAALVHLALVFPTPLRTRYLRLLSLIPYLIAAYSIFLGEAVMVYIWSDASWRDDFARRALLLDQSLLGVGVGLLLVRTLIAYVGRHTTTRARRQARLLLIPWGVLAISLAASFIIRAPDAQLSMLLAVWTIAGIVYTMLRYQTFAYRGLVLQFLAILLVSAGLAQVIFFLFLVLPFGQIDGVQFALITGVTFLTTGFWYWRTPLRHGFERLFFRRMEDYRIAREFALTTSKTEGLEETIRRSTQFIRTNLELDWVAILTVKPTAVLCLDSQQETKILDMVGEEGDTATAADLLPSPIIYHHPLPDGTGHIWLGDRLSAEPVDNQDHQLIALIGQHLTQRLISIAQFAELAAVPKRILSAIETERERIAHDIHDSALQFLGAMPLGMENTAAAIDTAPEEAVHQLATYGRQASVVSEEIRGLIRDLAMPHLEVTGLTGAIHLLVSELCHAADVELSWHCDGEGWNHLSREQAIQVYRIAQESVTNALKHGKPSTITISLRQKSDWGGELTIHDNGLGADIHSETMSTKGYGILFMQQRAQTLGATLSIESTPHLGTTVRLHLDFPNRL